MGTIIVGNIPEKISYIYADEEEINVGSKYDIFTNADEIHKNTKLKVHTTAVADSSREFEIDDAINLVTTYWQPVKGYVTRPHYVDETTNDPIKNVQIVSILESGSNTSYKVLINNKYYTLIYDDIVMDSMFKMGIDPGGILKGEYIWAKVNKSMKLIRIGSEIHNHILDYQRRSSLKKLGKREFVPGGIYQDLRKNIHIFIGFVDSVRFDAQDRYNYNKKSNTPKFEYKLREYKKAMLFCKVESVIKAKDCLESILSQEYMDPFVIKDSHNFIEKVGEIKLQDSNEIIENYRQTSLKEMKNKVVEYAGQDPMKNSWDRITDWGLNWTLERLSRQLHLRPYGKPQVELFDIKKFLALT